MDKYGLEPKEVSQQSEEQEAKENLQLNCQNITNCIKKVGDLIFNISFNQGLQYFITVSLAERATFKFLSSTNESERDAYKNLMLCYYIGIFLGRSSITFFKLKNWMMTATTILQIANVCVFWSIARNEWMPIKGMMCMTFASGLLGGSCFANGLYKLINTKKLDKN
jgi:uncharacterized membrane protein affecting hemolysin expression